VPAPKITVLTRIKSGMASWYGSVLQGHLTPAAGAQEFDLQPRTGPCRFGSRVKVTDLRNKRSVVVTYGPGCSVPERVIDLSFAAGEGAAYGSKMGVDRYGWS